MGTFLPQAIFKPNEKFRLMLKKLNKIRRSSLINMFLLIFYSVGVAGLAWSETRDIFITLMPYTLLLAMGLMFWVHKSWKPRHLFYFLLIVLLGFFVEVAGVLTGVVFGEYQYGKALGFKLWGTPPMIGLNWLMLIYAVYTMLRKMQMHRLLQILLGASLMVAYDVVMEPVAISLDMWSWAGGGIPLQNYVAWFVISLVMLSVLHLAKLRYRNRVAPWLFFIQMGFFLILNLLVT